EEGCLSVPGARALVPRAAEVTVKVFRTVHSPDISLAMRGLLLTSLHKRTVLLVQV
ncbi:peptide deformylase, partial [Vibrio sp. D406a]|uniref:peptide deformylase n=1 Tax=Vibrio sp. D406a TaxID=2836435 RepID=UPI0025547D4D